MGKVLDARTVKGLKVGEWARVPIAGKRGGGILEARALAEGVTYYLRITTAGRRERIGLGAIGYKEATRRASELSTRYQQGEHYLADVLKAEQAERERKHAEAKAASSRTLGALLEAYCAAMEGAGKVSAKDVRRSLHVHVKQAWPELWDKRADVVDLDDLLAVVARVVEAGHLRMAGQIRSYLKAAYNAGIKAGQRANAPEALRALRIRSNPAALLATVEPEKANEADDENDAKRALSLAELRAYWRRIEGMDGIDGAMLRFHLLTGGQRLAQLARATWNDYDRDSATLKLRDGKGKRTKARAHFVPLLPEALDDALAMMGNKYVFTATVGKSGVSKHVFAARLSPVVEAMQAAGELEGDPFTAADLRRTVETRLAGAGVSKETRAQVQSHGLSGVQQKHYDMHDYLDEKREALETLHRLCTGTGADVVPIKRKAR